MGKTFAARLRGQIASSYLENIPDCRYRQSLLVLIKIFKCVDWFNASANQMLSSKFWKFAWGYWHVIWRRDIYWSYFSRATKRTFPVEDHDRRIFKILWSARSLETHDRSTVPWIWRRLLIWNQHLLCCHLFYNCFLEIRIALWRHKWQTENCETILCLILSKIAELYFHCPLQAFICSSLIGAISGEFKPRRLLRHQVMNIFLINHVLL